MLAEPYDDNVERSSPSAGLLTHYYNNRDLITNRQKTTPDAPPKHSTEVLLTTASRQSPQQVTPRHVLVSEMPRGAPPTSHDN